MRSSLRLALLMVAAALVLSGLASGLYRSAQDDAPLVQSPRQKERRNSGSQPRVFETTDSSALLSEKAQGGTLGDGADVNAPLTFDAGVAARVDERSDAAATITPPQKPAVRSPDETSEDAGATPEADESTEAKLAPRRFQVRWNNEGQCAEKPLAALRASREALL